MINKNKDYEKIEKDLLIEHNKIRKNPKCYIPKLKECLKYFTDKIFHPPNEEPIQTCEGKEAIEEAIAFLNTQKPVKELEYSDYISQACKDHVLDIGKNGLTTHEGSDNKNISDRIEKYCEWEGAMAENLEFTFKNAENIMVNLIVCDGVKERFQRKNLFFPDFKYIGIGVGYHKDYDICCSIGYTNNLRNLGEEPTDVSNFIQDYIKNTMGKDKKNINPFQEDDPDAPDNTTSVKIVKLVKNVNNNVVKVTRKIFSLDNGATHIVEIEEN